MLTALIIDDEPLAHQVLLHHLQDHPDIQIAQHCYSAVEALNWFAAQPDGSQAADLLFLDINMPALNGIDMLKVLANKPQVIIVSAYQEYALQGFELEVTDYLLKPVSALRLNKALDRVHAKKSNQSAANTHIAVKVDRTIERLEIARIQYLEAYGNYVKVWHDQQVTLANSTLKTLLQQLPQDQFVQIHKSHAINRHYIQTLKSDSVTLADRTELNIGKTFRRKIYL